MAGTPRLLADEVEYDGVRIRARLLVKAEKGGVAIDKRLMEYVHLTVEKLRECGTGKAVAYMEMDAFPPPPKPSDMIRVDEGFLYGKVVEFPLFILAEGPDCVDLELCLTINGRCASTQGIHAVRTRAAPP